VQEIIYLIFDEIRPIKCSMTVFKTAVYGFAVYILPLTRKARKLQTKQTEERLDILNITSLHAKNESSDCVYIH